MKSVKINIKNANVKADFKGFEGNKCEVLADKINARQLTNINKEYKPEYFFETQESQTNDNMSFEMQES